MRANLTRIASINSLNWLVFIAALAALIFTFFFTAKSFAAALEISNNQQTEQKLDKLRDDIKALQAELEKARDNKRSTEEQLRITEKSISKINLLLRSLERKIHRQDNEVKTLKRQQSATQGNISLHKKALSQQLRTSYLMGKQPYLKLLLNQQQPEKMARTTAYFSYYNRARLEQIQILNQELTKLESLENKIIHTTTQLEKDRGEKLAEKNTLQSHRKNRVTLLASINSQISQKDERLQQLQEDEQRLKLLVQQIQNDAILAPTPKQPFATLKGQLQWPVNGKISAKYGSKREIGQLIWQGVLIASQAGTEVHAVSHGRVAFADWLRGFGLLMILDHGNGYMSLYGHNESLFKEQGEWVEANEVIARLGEGNGKLSSGLYFEIRHNGKPINPTRWCRKSPTS